jgi:iron only hydrogenase large subunit-like protein
MSTTWNKPPTTTAVSSTAINVYPESSNNSEAAPIIKKIPPEPELSSHLPIFTSNCPGWICYAEKTTPQVLPYISNVKSPQQIIGTLMKYFLSLPKLPELGTFSDTLMEGATEKFSSLTIEEPSSSTDSANKERKTNLPLANNVIMVSIQPCFDKKLEASRKVRSKCSFISLAVLTDFIFIGFLSCRKY